MNRAKKSNTVMEKLILDNLSDGEENPAGPGQPDTHLSMHQIGGDIENGNDMFHTVDYSNAS